MQLTTSNSKRAKRHSNSAEQQSNTIKAEAIINAQHKIAAFCMNSAGEKTPKTDLTRLLGASCDCV